MIKRGDMNPRWWHHPSVQPYVNVATYLAVFYLEAPTGRWKSVRQMQVEDMLFWGRFGAGVVPGTLAVLVVFLLGQWVFGTRIGLVASALFAVMPGVVEVSQYNKPDSLLVLFSATSVLVTLVYFDRGARGLALAAGVVVGLAVAVKYNAALLLIPFFLAVTFPSRHRHRFDVRSLPRRCRLDPGFHRWLPVLLYADLARFLDHVGAGLFNYGFQGLAGASGVDNWKTHALYTARYGAGVWAFLAGLMGLTVALWRIDRRLLVFLAYPVLYYSFYSSQRINFAGNLMPVYPFSSDTGQLRNRRGGCVRPWVSLRASASSSSVAARESCARGRPRARYVVSGIDHTPKESARHPSGYGDDGRTMDRITLSAGHTLRRRAAHTGLGSRAFRRYRAKARHRHRGRSPSRGGRSISHRDLHELSAFRPRAPPKRETMNVCSVDAHW